MIDQNTVDDSTERWLDGIEEKVDYKAWLCGHWHIEKQIDKLRFLFHDVLGAKASGIDSMGVRYGFAEEQELEIAGADYIVETVEDIRGKLKTL